MVRNLLIALVLLLFMQVKVQGQCTNNNTFLMNYSPACTGSPETITSCIQGGQYVAVTVVAGTVYTFSTCGNTAFDSQITLFNSGGGGALGYNDDGCGLQSTVTWTATFSGTLWVLVDRYNCTNNAICIPLNVTCTTPPPPSSNCLAPIPDICTQACNLGTLPAPPPCTSSSTINAGAVATFNLSNVGAIAENPYSAITGCATPATDVWYRFQATGTQLVLNIASLANALNNPNVSLYNGNNCNALLPLACFTGTGGALSQTYSPITPGDFYYLQISGGNAADVGDFTLAIRNNYDCDNCLLVHDLQVTPAPVNGTYGAGQTVQFCFTVSNYNQTAANWIHGIDLNFGPGWNLSTLSATTIPPSCAATAGASWGFYNSVTGNVTGNTYGPGFWYETTSGSSSGVIDGNPGNNFGDVGVGINCPRTFCWQVTTNPPGSCTPGASLAVSINTLGDYETGSWGSSGCTTDPIINFLAALACCAQPQIVVSNTNCGLNDGKIVASGSGSAPWDYVWANASGTVIATRNNINGADSLTGLASGNYFLTVTDNLGCSVGTSITVNASAAASTIASNTGPYCEGQTVTLGSSNGATGYSWSGPGAYTSTQQNPARTGSTTAMSGTYTVTVTITGGCTATASTNVVVNALPVASISPATIAICSGTSATLTASGGSTYVWSNTANTASVNVSPLSNTTYSVTVTDANTCTATASRLVTVNALPVASISPASVTICNGATTTLTATGGGNYTWSSSETTSSITVTPNTTTTYSVTITDANTCTSTASGLVTVNPLPVAVVSPAAIAICNGTSTTLTASGGGTYAWSNAATGTAVTVTPNTTTTYTVTVTDVNTCTATASGVVTVNALPVAAVSPSTIAICSGNSATLTASGGSTYVWSNAANTASITVSPLSNTTYTVTVTDANTCTATASASITVNPLPVVSVSPTAVAICNGASTTLTATGVGNYNWNSTETTASITVTPNTTTTYSVTVTDANTCTASVSGVVTVNSLPVAVVSPASVAICNGASTTLTASGGGTYIWSNGATTTAITVTPNTSATYTVTVTDANTCTATASGTVTVNALPVASILPSVITICNGTSTTLIASGGNSYSWSNAMTTASISITPASNSVYDVTVTDVNLCTATASSQVTVIPTMNLSTSVNDVSCNGDNTGSVNLMVTSGQSPYTFAWSNAAVVQNLTSVTSGNYSVTVTDNALCTATTSAVITEPAALVVSEIHADADCGGATPGAIDVTNSGGVSPYVYLWNDAVTTQDRFGISGGNYSLTVTDNNLCTATISVLINTGSALTLSETHSNVLCFGQNDASINISGTGGTTPYTFSWNDGATTQNRTSLLAGVYTVTAYDNATCSASASINITEPTPFSLSITHTNVTCNGGNAGTITLSPSGGTLPYSFVWNDGNTSQNRNFVTAGNYAVTVTDNNGCTFSISTVVTQPNVLSVVNTHTDLLCNGTSTGAINVSVNGGTSPYSFLWNDGNTSQNRSNIAASVYSVTITDANSCSVSVATTVTEPPALVVSETNTDVLCNGDNSGSATITATGGTAPLSFTWNDGVTTQSRTNLTAGMYILTVTDGNSCSASVIANVSEPAVLSIGESHLDVLCYGVNTGSIDVTLSGGVQPYAYLWNDAVTGEDRNNIPVGSYSVTVSDANSCTATIGATITEPAALTAGETHVDVACSGFNTGSIDVTVLGGVTPYVFAWNDASTTEDRNSISDGNYSVTITDNHQCSTSLSIAIISSSGLSISETHNDVSCNSLSDGTIDIVMSGGTPPYAFLWNDGTTTQNRTGVPAGSYSVSATDVNSCIISLTINVAEPVAVTVIETHTNVTCSGYNDGTAALFVSGGTPSYTYLWDDGVTLQNRTNLAAGTYSLTVSDNHLCTASFSVTITEPSGMNLSSSFVNPTCEMNTADGSITLNVTGGSIPYQYHWSNGSASSNPVNLLPGNYLVTVTDANNCSLGAAFSLVYQFDFSVDATPSTTISFGETTVLGYTLTGVSGNYTNVWNPSGSLSCADCASPVASPSNTTLYQIQVTNDAGCTASDTLTVYVVPDYTIYVPNAFTPNGDGNNDLFEIYGKVKSLEFLHVQIFNRWGEKVFESYDHSFSWDGTFKGVLQNPGVYVWQLKLTFLDGHREDLRKGTVTLIK